MCNGIAGAHRAECRGQDHDPSLARSRLCANPMALRAEGRGLAAAILSHRECEQESSCAAWRPIMLTAG